MRLGIAYVNHALRDSIELSKEEQLIKKAASSYKVALHLLRCERGEIENLAKERGKGIEEAAREIRYTLLENCRMEYRYDHILTGHHKDDQIETILMRLFKGSGVHGLTGIPGRIGNVIRPLLQIPKSSILSYLDKRDLTYSIDTTNLSDSYERNRVRNRVIPLLQELYPGYESALGHMADKMEITSSYLQGKTSHLDSLLTITEHSVSWNSSVFESLSQYERMELLYRGWNIVCKEEEDLPFAVIQKLALNGLGELSESKNLFSLKGITCNLVKETVFLTIMVVPTTKNRYLKVIDSGSICLFPGYDLICESIDEVDMQRVCIPKDAIRGKLIVRSYLEGDVIGFAHGTKRVVKLYNDWKIPKEERWKIPVIVSHDEVIGILGKAFGWFDRISSTCKIELNDISGTMLSLRIESVGDRVEFEQ